MDEDKFRIPVKHERVALIDCHELDKWFNGQFPGRKWSFMNMAYEPHQDRIYAIEVYRDYIMTGLVEEFDAWLVFS